MASLAAASSEPDDDIAELLQEFADLRSKISSRTATSADVNRARSLKPIVAEWDSKMTTRRPDWNTLPTERGKLWIINSAAYSRDNLATEQRPMEASGTHLVQISKHPFARGGVRVAFYARVKVNGEGDWKQYIAKTFLEPRHQRREQYLGQLENNAVVKFLAEKWMQTPTGRSGLKIQCVDSRAMMVTRRTGSSNTEVWYHLEGVIDGKFDKWTDNAGKSFEPRENRQLLEFAKWTQTYTRGLLMATDLQGGKTSRGYKLTDPAVVCPSQVGRRFGPTNFNPEQLAMCLEGVEHGLKAGRSLYPDLAVGSSYAPGFTRRDPDGRGFAAVKTARDRRRAAVLTNS